MGFNINILNITIIKSLLIGAITSTIILIPIRIKINKKIEKKYSLKKEVTKIETYKSNKEKELISKKYTYINKNIKSKPKIKKLTNR